MSRKSRRNRPEQGADTASNSPPTQAGRTSRRGLVVGGLAAALVIAAIAMLFSGKNTRDTQQASADTAAALASEHSPTLGPPDARVHIVEFLDPACETCAQFYPVVKQLLAEHPQQIRLSVRHVAFHEGAEYVVRLLEASRRQDRYWQTLEALLGTQAQWAPHHTVDPALALQAASAAGLNLQQLISDMNSPEVTGRVQRDRQDAMTLQVVATPEFIVNGRRLPSFGLQQLLGLVEEELR